MAKVTRGKRDGWTWIFSKQERELAREIMIRKLRPSGSKTMVPSERLMTTGYIGLLGEVAFSRIFKTPIIDMDVDFVWQGKEIDVKTRERGRHFYMPRVVFNEGLKADVYVIGLMNPKKTRCELSGWLTKKDIEVHHEPVDLGYGPSVRVEDRWFRPMDTLADWCKTTAAWEE